tara:strand:+ start:1517 stop:1804 length:288 start_codon:yes stop_codon:yes gene_type:complete
MKTLPEPTLITEDEFWDDYQPIEVGGDLCTNDRALVETYPIDRVWTVVDGTDDGSLYAVPRYHWVNCVGYVVTQKARDNDEVEAVYMTNDPAEEE